VEVSYMPVFVPSAEEVADAKLFASNVRAAMAGELGVGVTEHSYDDVWLSAAAEAAHVDQTFTMSDVRKRLVDLSVADVVALLKRFHELDSNGSGDISLEEFVDALGMQGSRAYAARLFSFFDVDETGSISFSELLLGLALLSPSCSAEDKLKLAFLTCDMDASGGVSLADLKAVFQYTTGHSIGGSIAAPGGSPAPPALSRSKSSLEKAFAKYDADQSGELDYAEFSKFVEEHVELLQMARSMAQDRLPGLSLSELAKEVPEMKRERSDRRQRSSDRPSASEKAKKNAHGCLARLVELASGKKVLL